MTSQHCSATSPEEAPLPRQPYLYAGGLAQTYWADLEATPVAAAAPAGGLLLAQFP